MYDIFLSLLRKKGVKAADVARETGLHPSTFSDWKRGKSAPKTDKLQKIADFFGVSVEYLTTGKTQAQPIDKDLQFIIETWPALSDRDRSEILQMVEMKLEWIRKEKNSVSG